MSNNNDTKKLNRKTFLGLAGLVAMGLAFFKIPGAQYFASKENKKSGITVKSNNLSVSRNNSKGQWTL